MMDLTPTAFRKDLDSLSRRLQDLSEGSRRSKLSEAQQTAIGRIQGKKDQLAARLLDAERNWDLIKTEFVQDWNAFVADLEDLEESLADKIGAGRS